MNGSECGALSGSDNPQPLAAGESRAQYPGGPVQAAAMLIV